MTNNSNDNYTKGKIILDSNIILAVIIDLMDELIFELLLLALPTLIHLH